MNINEQHKGENIDGESRQVEPIVINRWHKFNTNHNVKVKLKPKGMEILAEKWGGTIPNWFHKHYDEGEGYYRFQLHELMLIFGEEMYNGNMNLPFKTEIYIDLGGSL